jgi:hypothetical protein
MLMSEGREFLVEARLATGHCPRCSQGQSRRTSRLDAFRRFRIASQLQVARPATLDVLAQEPAGTREIHPITAVVQPPEIVSSRDRQTSLVQLADTSSAEWLRHGQRLLPGRRCNEGTDAGEKRERFRVQADRAAERILQSTIVCLHVSGPPCLRAGTGQIRAQYTARAAVLHCRRGRSRAALAGCESM